MTPVMVGAVFSAIRYQNEFWQGRLVRWLSFFAAVMFVFSMATLINLGRFLSEIGLSASVMATWPLFLPTVSAIFWILVVRKSSDKNRPVNRIEMLGSNLMNTIGSVVMVVYAGMLRDILSGAIQ